MNFTPLLLLVVVTLVESVYHPPPATTNICHKHHKCHKLAQCIPQGYSFKCVCHPGFFGNGQFCTRFPICSRNPCPAGSTCLPRGGLFGGYRCVCNFGYYRVGRTCVSAQSCQFRCGRLYNPLFPCQCDASCSSYGLCCQDFKLQCPRIVPLKLPTKKPVYGLVHPPQYGSHSKPIHVVDPSKHVAATHPPIFEAHHPPAHKPVYPHPTPKPTGYPTQQHVAFVHGNPAEFAPASLVHKPLAHFGQHHPPTEKHPPAPQFPQHGGLLSQGSFSQTEFHPATGFEQPSFVPVGAAGHGNPALEAGFERAPVVG